MEKSPSKVRSQPPRSLPIKEDGSDDNKMTSSGESPIVDAYEKECRDAPEKIVRELEKEGKSKQCEEGPLHKKERKEVEDLDESDLKAFETAMKEAIQKKEEEGGGGNR